MQVLHTRIYSTPKNALWVWGFLDANTPAEERIDNSMIETDQIDSYVSCMDYTADWDEKYNQDLCECLEMDSYIRQIIWISIHHADASRHSCHWS